MRVFTVPEPKRIVYARFSPTGEELTVTFTPLRRLAEIRIHLGGMTIAPHRLSVRASCFEYSRDGRWFVTGGLDGIARVFADGLSTLGTSHAELVLGHDYTRGDRSEVAGLAFLPTTDPTRQWLAVSGSEFWLWNAHTQQYHVAPEREEFGPVSFAPAGDAVYVGRSGSISKYTIRPFQDVWPSVPVVSSSASIRHLLTSPDGTVVVATDQHDASVRSAEDGRERFHFRLSKSNVRNIAFFPNSRLLAVADGSPTLRVYDTDTGTLAREYDWGIGGIHCVTFSNDGAMGAAGGDKGRVVVWDVD